VSGDGNSTGPATERDSGVVEAIFTAPEGEARMSSRERVELHAGKGIPGDRYFAGTGTFWKPGKDGQDLTLIEAEALDALREAGIELDPSETRRNVLTRGIDLNALVGREFWIGTARAIGQRLCEPCTHLERMTGRPVMRPLVHRGGLRADLLTSGEVAVGDPVVAETAPVQP
jgi:MOSC domain-containing protein YiiM